MSAESNAVAESVQLQDPTEEIKPRLGILEIPELVTRLYGLKVVTIQELPSYDDLNFHVHVEIVDNRNLTEVKKDGYVLKILNSLQSKQPVIIEAQHALCKHVREHGVPVQEPVLTKEGRDWSIETFAPTEKDDVSPRGPYLVRMVTFLPGTIFHKTPYIPPSFYNVGIFLGKLHQAIKGFHHSFYDTYEMIWNLTKVPLLRDFIGAVKDPGDVAVVTEVIDAFEKDVVPLYPYFTKGLIHGDVNEQNLIMMEVPGQDDVPREQRAHDVCGLLDFNDVNDTYVVMDVAICITYMSIDCPKDGQIDVGGHVLAGYYKSCSLKQTEFDALKTLVCARLCQSLVLGAHSYSLQPGNTYLLTTAESGWPLLHKLWEYSNEQLAARWKEIIRSYDS